ncbi:hypothetical protein H1P_1210019 [Hyella patelloides LEGE 07179]|uniref:Uncharacterized protein n=1 Tax=Hyella patelloides LEGE 07179 TaxID=945734 RepID=A0A563VK91_9CYAN|nr:hypothetical protein [Hyella patelloides]VEP11828.1 hypothetical protein H1P_1210019 [Hyella patelloides LEGE 07179]
MSLRILDLADNNETQVQRVEFYFKHRYKGFNYRIGKLTEYYKFKDIELVIEDLRSMQPKIQ